jgi:hypothetical protein
MEEYYLAEINIARMKGVDINDPIMKEFADNIDEVNELAEGSKGFVWRLKDDNNNSSAYVNAFDDEQLLVNVSVWEDMETFEHFMYKTFHSEFLKRRKEWFHAFGKAHTAMWWVKKGHIPSLEEAMNKLNELQKNGASALVFDLKNKFEKPL